MAHHLLDFVALQVADEVQGGAVVGVLLQLLYHLLHPVLPQGVDAGCHGLPAGGGIVHLAGAHQQDLLRVPAGLPGRRGHVRPDPGPMFSAIVISVPILLSSGRPAAISLSAANHLSII